MCASFDARNRQYFSMPTALCRCSSSSSRPMAGPHSAGGRGSRDPHGYDAVQRPSWLPTPRSRRRRTTSPSPTAEPGRADREHDPRQRRLCRTAIMPSPANTHQRAQSVHRRRIGKLRLRRQRQPDLGRHDDLCLYAHREPAGVELGRGDLAYDPLGRLYRVTGGGNAPASSTTATIWCSNMTPPAMAPRLRPLDRGDEPVVTFTVEPGSVGSARQPPVRRPAGLDHRACATTPARALHDQHL